MVIKRVTYPITINAFNKGPGPLRGLDRGLEHAVHVDVIALDEVARSLRLGRRPPDEDALVQLPLERELTRRGH